MSVSIQQIIAKKHKHKWGNYPKIKEAVKGAYESPNNWCEVELSFPWAWRHSFHGNHIRMYYRCASEHKTRTLIASII